MQIKLFTIPAFDSEAPTEEMNKFIRSHRVLEIKQEFVSAENGAYWCFSIKYISGENKNYYSGKKEKTDYRKILDEKTFLIFEKLRAIRKEIAQNDAVPAYSVFIDKELVEITKLKEITIENIQKIKGIGEKKVEKYGKLFVEKYNK